MNMECMHAGAPRAPLQVVAGVFSRTALESCQADWRPMEGPPVLFGGVERAVLLLSGR